MLLFAVQPTKLNDSESCIPLCAYYVASYFSACNKFVTTWRTFMIKHTQQYNYTELSNTCTIPEESEVHKVSSVHIYIATVAT